MAGDYILAVASGMLARLQNEQVIILLSQVLKNILAVRNHLFSILNTLTFALKRELK